VTDVRLRFPLAVFMSGVVLILCGGCWHASSVTEPTSAWEAQYRRAAQTVHQRSAGAVLMSIATSQVDLPASPDALTFATSFTFIDPSGSTYAIRFDDITTTQIASMHTGSRFPPPSPDDLVLFQSLPETVVWVHLRRSP
jgi:uncharacterized protein YceK